MSGQSVMMIRRHLAVGGKEDVERSNAGECVGHESADGAHYAMLHLCLLIEVVFFFVWGQKGVNKKVGVL